MSSALPLPEPPARTCCMCAMCGQPYAALMHLHRHVHHEIDADMSMKWRRAARAAGKRDRGAVHSNKENVW